MTRHGHVIHRTVTRAKMPSMREKSLSWFSGSDLRRHLPISLLLAATVVLYARGLGRDFVSEDFIILRRLSEAGFFETARAQLTGPWLDVTFFRFYRPIGTLVLQVEWLLFGIAPLGYGLVHLAAHGLGVWLVYRLACRLIARRDLAAVACVPFALYPLGPNTVLFIASFATLFSTLAFVGAILLFLRWRDGRHRTEAGQPAWHAGAGSLILGALAMGTYEGAVVLPAMLLSLDVLLPRSAKTAGLGRRLRAGYHVVSWALLGLYFVLRRVALGTVVGGYPDLAAVFSGERLEELALRVQVDLSRLVLPTWGAAHPSWLAGLIDVVLVLACLMALVRWRTAVARFWWLGLIWIWLTQLPFGVVSVVPANGRYWYLASIGLVFWAAAALRAARRPVRRRLAIGLGSVMWFGYGGLLAISVQGHAAAGELSGAVRNALSHHALTVPSGVPVIAHLEPEFVRQRVGPFAQTPLAQVLHWGLADALMPPFTMRDLSIYPLPRFPANELGPIFTLGRDDVLPAAVPVTWKDGGWQPMAPPADTFPRMAVHLNRERTFGFRAEGVPKGCRARAVIVARGHPDLSPWWPHGVDGTVEADLPVDTVATMLRLYPGPVYWWLEARDGAGKLCAQSALQQLDP